MLFYSLDPKWLDIRNVFSRNGPLPRVLFVLAAFGLRPEDVWGGVGGFPARVLYCFWLGLDFGGSKYLRKFLIFACLALWLIDSWSFIMFSAWEGRETRGNTVSTKAGSLVTKAKKVICVFLCKRSGWTTWEKQLVFVAWARNASEKQWFS